MATSGTTTLALTQTQLATTAIRKLGVLAKGQTPDADDLANAVQAINLRIAEFRKDGLLLWKRTEYSFAPVANQAVYNIGTSQTLNTAYPLNLLQAYKTVDGGTTKIPMEIISNWNYNRLPSGTNTGAPIQLTYQPKVNLGSISLWPTPDSTAASNTTITIIYQAPVHYFTGSSQTLDMPEEWYNAVVYAAAVDIAPEWGIPLMDRQQLQKEAEKHFEMATNNSGEDSSFFFQIERR